MSQPTLNGKPQTGGGSGGGSSNDLFRKSYNRPEHRRWSPEIAMSGESLTTNLAKNQITISATTASGNLATANDATAGRDVFALGTSTAETFLQPSRENHMHTSTYGPWGLAFWYKAASNPGTGHWISRHYVNRAWAANASAVVVATSGLLTYQRNGSPVQSLSTTDIAGGSWHSCVLCCDGLQIKAYIDGSLENTVTIAATTKQANHTFDFLRADFTNAVAYYVSNLMYALCEFTDDFATAFDTAGVAGNLQSIDTVATIPS